MKTVRLPFARCGQSAVHRLCLELLLILWCVGVAWPLSAASARIGDLDGDGQATVLDLALLLAHINRVQSLPADLVPFADLDQDGLINQADASLLAQAILGFQPLPEVAPTRVRDSSPRDRESGVALTRETILFLSRPLAADATIGNDSLYAEAGGRRLLSRIELSSDRSTITLFYLENLPGNSEVEVTFRGSGLRDLLGEPIDPDGDGLPGGTARIRFTTVNAAAAPGTAVIGRVLASQRSAGAGLTNLQEHPLEGVRISVDGMEETLFTTTDADGNFFLEPAPAGQFFVHIDGRTAKESQWPGEPYYPVVGKQWETQAGTTNLAGGNGLIYLPFIAPGTLQPVSVTQDTSISLAPSVLQEYPELEGVSIVVPANALFSDNGARGGSVGIAPVPPDRLPSPLPDGLNFPVVITVQTDGPSNFDRPVPARFPNLPDPITGRVLPPGAKSGLWSFNHDTGEWELQGQMTVTGDGRFVESDPGVGIRQPGWHGSMPAAGGSGGNMVPPKPPVPCRNDGEACDDGNRCTTNDRCLAGFCQGDYPEPLCGPRRYVSLSYSLWTEMMNDQGDNHTYFTGFDGKGGVCFDPAANGWRFQVTEMFAKGYTTLSTAGFTEPNPVDGGNVTRQNYCEMISDLASTVTRGRGAWHTLEAIRAHEDYHLNVDIPQTLEPLWRAAQAQIESEVLSCLFSKAEAEELLNRRTRNIIFLTTEEYFRQAKLFVAEHDTRKGDGAYLAGQAVLDKVADRVRQYAQEKGWPPCPPRAAVQTLAAAAASGVQPHLVDLTLTAPTNLLDPGQAMQLSLKGTFSDGAVAGLTPGGAGTEYFVDDPEIASVSSDGVVRALKPGLTAILVSHLAAPHHLPMGAIVSLTVRFPEDWDNDQMPDAWERAMGLNPYDPADAHEDTDGDGLPNLREYFLGTNPIDFDTDGDGLSDGREIILGSDPLGEGLPDPTPQTGLHYFALLNLDTGRVEQRGITDRNGRAFRNLIANPNASYRVFILQARTLRVGHADFMTPDAGLRFEIPAVHLRDDTSEDSDQDGLTDMAEFILGTDPDNPDSDGDGIPDGSQFPPGQYRIAIGDVVGPGLPARGAGEIGAPGEKDYYTFNAQPGQMVYLSLLSNEVPCCVEWKLESDDGRLYFWRPLENGDVGRFTLQEGGLYSLTVGDGGTNQTGTYQFKFWDATPQQFELQLGDSVADGVPAAGAGNLETPGALDVYRFTAPPGQEVYLEFKEPSLRWPLEWRLEGENRLVDFGCLNCLNPGVLILRDGGTYRLILGTGLRPSFDPTPPDTGTYEFKLWEVPPAQRFTIQIGDRVTNGVPAVGAGVIEIPGEQDFFTFTATPGQRVYFQALGTYDFFNFMGWALRDEDGERIFNASFNGFEPGAHTLTRGGVYTILVDDRRLFTTGPYQFQLWNVPPPDTFAITLGDPVADGVPGPGAGRIETPGAQDVYTFHAEAGDKVSFAVLNKPVTTLDWRLEDESGEEIFRSCLGCFDPGTFVLSRGGIYTLTVGDDYDSWTGPYQIQIQREP